MRSALAPPSMWRRPLLDLTLSHPYIPELGFSVAVDGAARLGRALPAMGLTSVHPPGAFYQDHPMSDDVKVTRLLVFPIPSMQKRYPKVDAFLLHQFALGRSYLSLGMLM